MKSIKMIRQHFPDGGFVDTPDNTGATLPTISAPVPVPVVKIISKIAFMNLFTDAELIAIYDAAKLSTALHVWIKKLEASTDVKLSSPTTVAGVKALEAAGLIAVGRAAVILK